jgi:hypothetical protein
MTRARFVESRPAHDLPKPATARSVLLTGALVAGPLIFAGGALACSSSGGGGDDGSGSQASPEAGTSPTDPGKPVKPPSTGDDGGGGNACQTSADCMDPQHEVCDPDTARCIDAECGPLSGKQCAASKICVYQTSGVAGVCSDPCSPFGTPCAAQHECQIGSMDGVKGFCKAHGTGAPDAPCTVSDITTSCQAGYVCVADPTSHFCREQCDFFGSKHACTSASTRCVPPGFCIGEASDPAKPGEDCAAGAELGKPCAESSGKGLGVCFGKGTSSAPPYACYLWCRYGGNDCPTGQTCKPSGSPSVGYCQ